MKNNILKRLATAAFLVTTIFALGACNTMEGFGEDVETAGGELEEAAD